MKIILVLCASILVIGAGYLVWRSVQPEHFGKAFAGAPLVPIEQLAEAPVNADVKVEGKIVRQCPMTGCWFYLDDGKGHQIRIEFTKTLPKLPQKVGRQAVVEGQMARMGEEPVLVGSAVEFK